MRAEPDTADLIALARQTLKAELLPHLPADRLYLALMVLNALGIAHRQLVGGTQRRVAAEAALAPFTAGATLDARAAELARALRSGEAASDPAALYAALRAVARLETDESHPAARVLSAGEHAKDR